jgi:hypothetical protein
MEHETNKKSNEAEEHRQKGNKPHPAPAPTGAVPGDAGYGGSQSGQGAGSSDRRGSGHQPSQGAGNQAHGQPQGGQSGQPAKGSPSHGNPPKGNPSPPGQPNPGRGPEHHPDQGGDKGRKF